MEQIIEFLLENNIEFEANSSLKNKTWIKTGGIVGLWIVPITIDQLVEVITYLNDKRKHFEVVGHTSNLYYLDTYSPDIIISTIKVNAFRFEEEYIECDCGTPVAKISRIASNNGCKGFYGLVNLPGTVAAALVNNSSCFDCSISELLIEAKFLDTCDNSIKVLRKEDFGFSKRNSLFKSGLLKGIILSVKLKKVIGNINIERNLALEATRIRKETQEKPAMTLGSVYADFISRKCLKNIVLRFVDYFMIKIGAFSQERHINFILLLYGYRDLGNFISPKNINTFIWKEGYANQFLRYQEMMNKVFNNPRIEIEIRG